jgi:uncharacterized protein (TIGR04255 family)
MPADIDPKGQFEPLHAAHAIEQVALVVHFNREIADDELAAIRKALSPFSDDLPAKSEVRTFNIAFAQGGGPSAKMPVQAVTGFVMGRISAKGSIEKEFRVERGSLTFRNLVYTRWAGVSGEAHKYFAAAFAALGGDCSIAAVGLTYIDKFLWNGNLEDSLPSTLLRVDSPYLSPHVVDKRDMWHSHTGSFEKPNSHTKRLLNVNVDCLEEEHDEKKRRVISITMVLSDGFNQPYHDAVDFRAKDSEKFLAERMDDLHAYSKDVFSQLLNKETKIRIGLIGSDEK